VEGFALLGWVGEVVGGEGKNMVDVPCAAVVFPCHAGFKTTLDGQHQLFWRATDQPAIAAAALANTQEAGNSPAQVVADPHLWIVALVGAAVLGELFGIVLFPLSVVGHQPLFVVLVIRAVVFALVRQLLLICLERNPALANGRGPVFVSFGPVTPKHPPACFRAGARMGNGFHNYPSIIPTYSCQINDKLPDKAPIGHRESKAYESPALPLSHPGEIEVISVDVVVWVALS